MKKFLFTAAIINTVFFTLSYASDYDGDNVFPGDPSGISSSAFPNEKSPDESQLGVSGWYITLGAGISLPVVGEAEEKVDNFGLPNLLNVKKANVTPLLNAGAGYRWNLRRNWLPYFSAGLDYTFGFSNSVKGDIVEKALGNEVKNSYQYKLQRQTFLAIGKIGIYRIDRFTPFLLAGAGISRNTFKNYQENRISDGTAVRSDAKYKEKTSTELSYAVGGGLDFDINQNFQLSASYRYSFLGHVRSENGEGAFSDTSIKQKLDSHDIFLSLTYIFGA